MNPKIWLLVVACLFVTHAAARPVPAPVPEPILIEWWLWKKWKHHKDKKKWMKEQEEERQSLQQQEHEQAQQSDAFGNIVCRVSGKSSEECHKLNNP